jgi:hypothetical protein
MSRLARNDALPIREHEMRFEEVIYRETVFAGQIACTAPERQPATPVLETIPNGRQTSSVPR